VSEPAEQLLERAGIEAFAEMPEHPAHVECLRAAQRLRRSGCRSIGLVPASAEVGVVGIGVNLAIALYALSARDVAYVDANLRWPALPPPEVPPPGDSLYTTRWLRPNVALLAPRHRVMGGAGIGPLGGLLAAVRERYDCCLVDLTGWRRLGEHLPAFALVDGVAVVARAGLTTEAELLRFGDEIPPERHLGVVLTGAAAEVS
jgi:hypothetical protein